jgi:hypothetical protein
MINKIMSVFNSLTKQFTATESKEVVTPTPTETPTPTVALTPTTAGNNDITAANDERARLRHLGYI